MGKDKKLKLKIKTSRYFTKTCDNCQSEYPNWFTNCPSCGVAWDTVEKKDETEKPLEIADTKTIKIVVKITEEDFEEAINRVQLLFSADQGKSWYQMIMDVKLDYFIAEIAEVPTGSIIIYYVEVYLESGEKVIENNEGKYFYYQVGAPITEIKEEPPQEQAEIIQDNVAQLISSDDNIPNIQDYKEPTNDELTIFGLPQKKVEPDLKECPKCQSKIKKMWTVCPICGQKIS